MRPKTPTKEIVMSPVKKVAIRTQQFVQNNKTTLAVTATAATCVAVHVKVIKNMNDRLKEIGAYDKFYETIEENI